MGALAVATIILLVVLVGLGFCFWYINKKLSKPKPKVNKKKLLKK